MDVFDSNWLDYGHCGQAIGSDPETAMFFSGLPLWTWQHDQSLQNMELELGMGIQMMDHHYLPLPFLDDHLFQDDACSIFEGDITISNITTTHEYKVDSKVNAMNESKSETVKKETSEGTVATTDQIQTAEMRRNQMIVAEQNRRAQYNSNIILTFEDVSRCFYMPITEAAKELNVGLTLLKKKCRELGIPRWPHRKMKSLQTLINNVQELGCAESANEVVHNIALQCALEKLEQERRVMEREPSLQLQDNTKRLRQACFKANYKRRRLMALQSSN